MRTVEEEVAITEVGRLLKTFGVRGTSADQNIYRILTRFATGAFNCSPLYIPHHRLQDKNVELTKSPHEFGLAVSLLRGNPNVFQDPGGPVEVL